MHSESDLERHEKLSQPPASFGVYLGDPYMDGCQKVMALSAPRTRLWRSCDDRVLEFSPNGKRMVTTHILSDGAGLSKVDPKAARLPAYHLFGGRTHEPARTASRRSARRSCCLRLARSAGFRRISVHQPSSCTTTS